MKYMKRFFCLLTLVLLSLSLLAGCGSPDSESQDAEVIYDFGDTIERNGEQIDVCITHDRNAIYLYYNDEIDHGTFSYSTDESSTYYADSAIDDNVRYRVFEFDENALIWDEGIYYRME